MLTLTKNGGAENFSIDSDGNCLYDTIGLGAAIGFSLLVPTNQQFKMTLVGYIDNNADYELKFRTHQGDELAINKISGETIWVREEENMDYGNF